MRGHLVIDMQFGSTGKGLIAGYLAEKHSPDTIITAWAPNAGHTYIDRSGHKDVRTMLGNGTVSPALKRVLIGPGSVIDPVALRREMDQHFERFAVQPDVLIHPNAAIVTQEHRDLEAGPMTKIGSTKKGVGEAMIQRIRRDPQNSNTARLQNGIPHKGLVDASLMGCVATVEEYDNAIDRAGQTLVEGAHGFSLSMYHGFYPYCTSRDVTTHQILADCGIPLGASQGLSIVGTMRSFPIRVANRYDETGNQVGWSGPHYPDQHEIKWSDLDLEPELTTVTKLPRRIFSFSMWQVRQAARMCGVEEVFYNFANYHASPAAAAHAINQVNKEIGRHMSEVVYIGLGPTAADIIDLAGVGGSEETLRRTVLSSLQERWPKGHPHDLSGAEQTFGGGV